MPNRILKESILDSPTLAKLDDFYQDQFPRLLLLFDDWGCFNADPESVKGKAYPKRPKVTVKVVEKILRTYYDEGLLFMWIEKDRIYGYWLGWDDHNYCNASAVDDDGKQAKHRRKTPMPPKELLDQYVESHKDKLEHFRTKVSIPIPIPIPIPPSGNSLKVPVEFERFGKYGNVLLKPDDLADLRTRLGEHFDDLIAELDRYAENHPAKFAKYKNHAAVLETWHGRLLKRIKSNGYQNKQDRTAEASRRLLSRLDRQDSSSSERGVVRVNPSGLSRASAETLFATDKNSGNPHN